MTQTLLTVLGASVTVHACDNDPVSFRLNDLASSLVPSWIVIVAVEASDNASEPREKASAIFSREVFK